MQFVECTRNPAAKQILKQDMPRVSNTHLWQAAPDRNMLSIFGKSQTVQPTQEFHFKRNGQILDTIIILKT